MPLIAENLKSVWHQADEARESQEKEHPNEKLFGSAQQFIDLGISLWRATKEMLATLPPQAGEEQRQVANMLRAAEQAMGSTIKFARDQEYLGAVLHRAGRLMICMSAKS